MLDDIPGTAGRKALVFEFLFEALDFHVFRALGRTHFGSRPDKAGQFIGRKEDFFHQVLRCHVDTDAIAMADDGMDESVVGIDFFQQFRRLFTVLVRVFFKVHIVEQADESPKIDGVAIAQFLSIPAHDAFDSQGMHDVEGFLIIFLQ